MHAGTQFFVQNPAEQRVEWVARECAAAAAAPAPANPPMLKVNQKVLAKFSVDGQVRNPMLRATHGLARANRYLQCSVHVVAPSGGAAKCCDSAGGVGNRRFSNLGGF